MGYVLFGCWDSWMLIIPIWWLFLLFLLYEIVLQYFVINFMDSYWINTPIILWYFYSMNVLISIKSFHWYLLKYKQTLWIGKISISILFSSFYFGWSLVAFYWFPLLMTDDLSTFDDLTFVLASGFVYWSIRFFPLVLKKYFSLAIWEWYFYP